MVKKKERKRQSVTLTHYFIEGLDKLVSDGIYLNEGNIMREGMRVIFKRHGIKPSKGEDDNGR